MPPSSGRSLDTESANLDLLRSIAVLLVFGGHLVETVWPSMMGTISGLARFGVLIFFVHTALVLMMSLERTEMDARGFYIRRFFRIYPLSIFAITAVLVLRIPASPGPFVFPTMTELVATLTLFQNLLPFKALIIGPLWTLPYEVQMYMALPWIALATTRLRYAFDSVILWFLVFVATIPFGLTQFVSCFMAGVVCYKMRAVTRRTLPGWTLPLLALALTVLYVYCKRFALLQGPFCLALGLFIPHVREIENVPVRLAAKQIAKYSYGIYLLHAPVVMLLIHAGSSSIRMLAAVAVTGILAVALYHAIENPFIQLGKRVAGTRVPGTSCEVPEGEAAEVAR